MSHSDKKRKRDDDQTEQTIEHPQKVSKVELSKGKQDGQNGEAKKITGTARQKKSERKTKKQLKREQAKAEKLLRKKPSSKVDGLATGQDFVSLGGDENETNLPPRVRLLKREGRSSKGSSPRSIRKQRIAAKKASEAAETAGTEVEAIAAIPVADSEPAMPAASATTTTISNDAGNSQSKSRFIVFVGNLPYDATTEQVQAHFAKLQPASIRHQTDKKTGQSKGFAFLEFTNYDRMKTCLQLYHHSIFDPRAASTAADENADNTDLYNTSDNKQKSRGRKLNVELTAGGGGGKSIERKTKIQEKNKKLTEQRERLKAKALKKKADAERRRILKAEKEAKNGKKTGANAEAVATKNADPANAAVMGDIHPSRLSRVQG